MFSASEVSVVRVQIPTSSEFLKQWHLWVHGKVTKHFKRDKDRIPDTVQRVRLRLLSKDFVSRWFFKHLTDDLVDLQEATSMLGGTPVSFIGRLQPVSGRRTSPDSLWRIKDLLEYAKFDYERYFYTVQNHTIDTTKVLRLLGYGHFDPISGCWSSSIQDYGILESLYRQGRLKPSELTEHMCSEQTKKIEPRDGHCGVPFCDGKHYSRGYCSAHYGLSRTRKCEECDRGRMALKSRGVSLADRWTKPEVAKAVSKLRWNDSQLSPFLRDWANSNKIKSIPRYIIRDPKNATIDAGLLKYANMIIDNDVINHFKTMSRSDDLVGNSSESSSNSQDMVQIKKSTTGDTEQEFIDVTTHEADVVERRTTLLSIIRKASLTDDEMMVIHKADLEETSIKDLADSLSIPVAKLNKIRSSALDKMRIVALQAF